MVATNVKTETINLMDKRSTVESQMTSIINSLTASGGPGIDGTLVDSEGFPLPEIDIPTIRAQRRHLIELKNDYKEITEKIDRNLQILHSARLPAKLNDSGNQGASITDGVGSTASENAVAESSSAMDVDVILKLPFAVIDEITDSSPAAEDGLQLGDTILRFGNVEAGDNLMQRLATEGQKNQGSAVPVTVMRQGAMINLTVTPRTWQGRGLLG
ncbi:hypothetical protein ACFE04_009888 [Oxalis oulophora]